MERGQGTVEYLGLLAVLAVLLGAARARVAVDPPRVPWSRLLHAPRHPRARRTSGRCATRARRADRAAAPSIVLERDDYGDDLAIPVSDALPLSRLRGLRHGALRAVRARRPRRPRERSSSTGRTTRRRRPTICPCAALQGFHHDDWEGARVAFARDGHLLGARGERTPRLERVGALVGRAPRQLGSLRRHRLPRGGQPCDGLRRGDLDLAGDGWNGDLGGRRRRACDLRAADRAGRRARPFDSGRRGSLGKQAWSRSRRRAHRAARLVARRGCRRGASLGRRRRCGARRSRDHRRRRPPR